MTTEGSLDQSKKRRLLLIAILAIYLSTGLWYSVTIPIGEGYDEWGHFAYIRYVVNTHRLPVSGQRLVPEVQYDMTHHPPLYYLAGTLATFWVPMTDNLRPEPNPHLYTGGGLNAFIHSPDEAWPYRGSVLGFHVARLASLLMGALTLLLTYRIAREVVPARPEVALGATALTAAMPQFIFMSSIVNNDIGMCLTATWTLHCLVRLYTRRPDLRRVLVLSAALVSALLTKANAIALVPLSLIVLAVAYWHRRGAVDWMERVSGMGILMSTSTAVLWGWESWNSHLHNHYSSVIGAITRYIYPALVGGPATRGARLRWGSLAAGLRYTFQTFWAAFGWGNIPAEGYFYQIVLVLSLLGLVGAFVYLLRRRSADRVGILILIAAGVLALIPPIFLILVTGASHASPGRYALSVAPILGVLVGLGLSELAPSRWRAGVLSVSAAGLMAFSLLVPLLYLRPAYAQPRHLTAAEVERVAQPASFRFGQMELLGYRVQGAPLTPGEYATVSLYWRCLGPIDMNYTVAVQVLDAEQRFYGGTQSYPRQGAYPTTRWQPGAIIEDTYPVHLGGDFPAQSFAQLKVAVYFRDASEALLASGPHGETLGKAAIFGRVGVRTPQGPAAEPAVRMQMTFDDAIQLVGYDPPAVGGGDQGHAITLHWRALQPVDRDYTVFLHLVDAEGQFVDQADAPPRAGRYPTSLWQPGEQVADLHTIEVPAGTSPGDYRLRVGLYDPDTMERLPAADAQGQPLEGAYAVLQLAPDDR